MALPRHTGRSRFPLVVLLLASITLLTLDARDFGPVERVKDGLAFVTTPFRAVGDKVFSPIGSAWSSIGQSDELKDENQLLREEIDRLLDERISQDGAVAELEELRKAIGLEGTGGFETVVAEVTAGSLSNFDPYVLEINRGSVHGVQENMPVITPGGLIGRVEDVRARSSNVRLITDPGLKIGILALGTNEVGIISGSGVGELLRVADGIPVDAPITAGQILVTSGLERSPYPEGIAVGSVSSIEIDEVSLEKELIVTPTGQLDRLLFVTVVLYDPDADVLPSDPADEEAPE